MTTKQSPAETQPRVVRVFISSTFRDMQAERDELVKRIFPQLRKLCDERGVTWGEVDLRWGITDEQSAEGQVLPICLAEIQNCRPYFIGLLGERYGWVPDAFPQELIESESWLAEQSGNSVTELEILHGVLNDPEMAQHAFFYFRDPAYLNSLPEGERQEFLEGASQEEIEKYGKDEAERRAEARRQKLDALKERIRSSEFLVRENYPNPEALGEMVLNDLTALINRLYPEGEKIDALDREAMEHEAYATSRAKVYVKRQEYFDRLNKHVAGDDIPLIVLGESGSGKSALLASWALEYRKVHPNDLLLMHFIGSSPYSSDWAAMLRRIMSEFKRRFDIREEIPDKPDALRTAFANWLHMVSAKGRVILILDALNQLEDRDGALDLVWLPPVIPENIRLILSTLPGKSLDELKKRGWSTTQVKPLDEEERKRLIAEYLAQYKKALNQRQIELIASAPQSSNPLFVRALLDELRVFGIHELLDQRISHYLGARNIPELYSKILERYEQDYDNKRQELVRDTMLLVESARRGLSETELLELLGADGKPMPRAYWSPFYVTADQALVSHSGLITFAHDYLRQAVHDRYLSTEQEQHDCHIRLANYFESQPTSERKIDELPWQLAQAKEWQRLHNLLSDPEFFESAWEMNQFEVKAYWVQVESNSSLSLVQAYKEMLNKPNISDRIFWFTKNLYSDTGHLDESLYMVDFLVDTYRKIGDHANLAVSLGDRSAILWARGDFDEAMKLLKEQEQISHELGDKEELVRSLGNQALILKARGDPHQAMILLKEQESICREYNNKGKLGICLSNQGMILFDRGDLDGAMELFKEHERICRELGEKDLLSYALDSQASILRARGDLDGAMALCEQAEQICREVGHKEGLGRELSSLGSISFERGDLDKAMKLYKEAEHIGRGLGDAKNLYYAFEGQGLVFERRGNPEEAMKLFKDAERICRKLEYKAGLLKCLGHQARIQYADRNFEEVMKLQKEVEDIARLLGDKAALSQSLNTQSSILADRGDLNGAMKLLTEHENLCYELGDKEGAATSIDNQANIVYRHGDLDKAMKLYKEEERILR